MYALFFIMSMLLLASAVGVVAFKNPIHSALCLILNMSLVAGFFAMLDAHFLAVVQIIVYAGAIMVLVLFVLMLLNLKVEQPQSLRAVYVITAILCGGCFLLMVLPPLQDAFSVFPEPKTELVGTAATIGEILYTRYVFPFEAASLLIIAAILGAVMLAKRNYKSSTGQA